MNTNTLLTLFVQSVERQEKATAAIERVLRGDDHDMDNLHSATLDYITETRIQDKLEDMYYTATDGVPIREDAELWR